MPDENETTTQGSSLNIEAVLRKSDREMSHLPILRRSDFNISKVRDGVVEFLDKRSDSSTLNVVIDITMVVAGLGATAGILILVVLIVQLISGVGV
ncbi:MAG: hypothetical protein RBG13Loki_4011 [Promethearchaeota archaeon CR_4]|nr:MAG: hypothetical protein RBG13Loki_4011 [Candidatus Lokiarchaeota archaeon CR_4]